MARKVAGNEREESCKGKRRENVLEKEIKITMKARKEERRRVTARNEPKKERKIWSYSKKEEKSLK